MSTEELAWFKSSYSGGEGGACVEVAEGTGAGVGTIHVRDSKDAAGPRLVFTRAGWTAFAAYAAELV